MGMADHILVPYLCRYLNSAGVHDRVCTMDMCTVPSGYLHCTPLSSSLPVHGRGECRSSLPTLTNSYKDRLTPLHVRAQATAEALSAANPPRQSWGAQALVTRHRPVLALQVHLPIAPLLKRHAQETLTDCISFRGIHTIGKT